MHFITRSLGRTGITVSPLGLATGNDALPPREVERAFERGIRYFHGGTRRGNAFGQGVRAGARSGLEPVRETTADGARHADGLRHLLIPSRSPRIGAD